MKPSSLRYLQVLYLFAGVARKADLSTCLHALVAEFNRSAAFGFSVELTEEEIDILRGGAAHDLADKARRDDILRRNQVGAYGVVVSTPPCSNHTRAVFSNAQGPRPTRDFFHPEGYSYLTPAERFKTDVANTLIAFALQVLSAAAAAQAIGFLEFPEDLGATARAGGQLPFGSFRRLTSWTRLVISVGRSIRTNGQTWNTPSPLPFSQMPLALRRSRTFTWVGLRNHLTIVTWVRFLSVISSQVR